MCERGWGTNPPGLYAYCVAMFLRTVKTRSGATAVQIVSKTSGTRKIIEHIGSAHTPNDVEILKHAGQERLRAHRLASGQPELDLQFERTPSPHPQPVRLQRSCSRLLYDTLSDVYEKIGFDAAVDDRVFRDLVLARVIEPASKLDTIRVLGELGVQPPSNSAIHRALNRVDTHNYRQKVSEACVSYRRVDRLTLVLYDVTTLFFQIEKEDDYRKPGLSKERRLEPQIVVGLLTDEYGFPLQVHSFTGNTAETVTIVPVLDAFRKAHPGVSVTVVCDAGMLSAKNLTRLEDAGYDFIVGARVAKTPYDIAEYQAGGGEIRDGQIFETQQWFGRSENRRCRRVVYQYRHKRARLDLRNIDKQVEKAERVVSGGAPVKKHRFVKLTDTTRKLDTGLVESAKRRAGIKGYVTSLKPENVSGQDVVDWYHRLFNVEASFRMAKSDLRARPIYHRVQKKIEAHLTVVFCAMAVSRCVQEAAGVSVKKFVKTLLPVRDGMLLVGGREHWVPAVVPEEVQALVACFSE